MFNYFEVDILPAVVTEIFSVWLWWGGASLGLGNYG